MSIKRRELIQLAALAGAAGALTPLGLFAEGGSASASRPLRILFLGGTGFIGPHMVQRAVERGHTVTLFNRGRNSDEFPDLEQLVGDRDGQLGALEGRQWDAVVDNSGYVPRHVDDSAKLLAAGGTPHYLFISTVAVYDNFGTVGMDESAPLATMADPTVEEVNGDTYGPLKVLCEQAVLTHYPAAHTILRPTYIVGPGDPTDRFIYYIDRPLAGGRMPVPGPQSLAINYVDVRDLAEFTIRSLEERINGIYNMVNAPGGTTFGDVMRESQAASGADLGLVWITAEFMKEHGLEWQFPMCPNPLGSPANGHLSQAAAVAQGFTNRPFAETVKATYDWWMAQTAERRAAAGKNLPLEVQQAWLAAVDGASELWGQSFGVRVKGQSKPTTNSGNFQTAANVVNGHWWRLPVEPLVQRGRADRLSYLARNLNGRYVNAAGAGSSGACQGKSGSNRDLSGQPIQSGPSCCRGDAAG